MRISTKTVCECITEFCTAPAVVAKAEAEKDRCVAMVKLTKTEIEGLQASLDSIDNDLVAQLVTDQIERKQALVKQYVDTANEQGAKAETARTAAHAIAQLKMPLADIATIFAVFTEYFLKFGKVASEVTDAQAKAYLNATLLALQTAVVQIEKAKAEQPSEKAKAEQPSEKATAKK